jgi:hypothetical protein
VARELWSLLGLEESTGGGTSKVTVLLLLKVTSLSIDELAGDVMLEGSDVAPRSLLEVVDAIFAFWGTCGVSDELLTAAAYVGGLVLCADNLGLDDGMLSGGVAGADGVFSPGGVVPGGGGGGEGGGEAIL